MVMSWVFTGIVALSLVAGIALGNGSALAGAIPEGAQAGLTLAISLGGSICLWCGIGRLMEQIGLTSYLSRFLGPLLKRVFPSTKKDPYVANRISANVCANFLGLGNAATPMGIQAAQRLAQGQNGVASNELCRLIVLNTASIQLIPTNVAAIRSSLGAVSPFDILPAVWITSVCSAGLGLMAAWFLGKVWKI